jgi:hypothetical protein
MCAFRLNGTIKQEAALWFFVLCVLGDNCFAKTVSKHTILNAWANSVIDPVVVGFEVTEEKRSRGQKQSKVDEPFGGDDKSPSQSTSVDVGEHAVSWKFWRDKSIGMVWECTSVPNRIYVSNNEMAFSIYGSQKDVHPEKEVVLATRGDKESDFISKSLHTRIILDWIDPLVTRNGELLKAVDVVDLHEENGTGLLPITIEAERTVWYSPMYAWRPVRETFAKGNALAFEMVYEWGFSASGDLLLKGVLITKIKGDAEEVLTTRLAVGSVNRDPIPVEKFQLKFSPGTVISDTTDGSDKIYVVTHDGNERIVPDKERAIAASWEEILSRESPPEEIDDGQWLIYPFSLVVIFSGLFLVFRYRRVQR